MKQYKRLIMAELIFFLVLLLCPIFLVINRSSMNINSNMKKSEWIPLEPDNLLYTEDFDVKILKDGSVSKMWSLIDHGIGNITFPIELPTPVNSTSLALLDLRVRLAVVQHERFPATWGPVTYRDESYEFIFDDNLGSIVPHIFLEYYALIDNLANQSLLLSLLNNLTSGLESLWPGVHFSKFAESTGLRISQVWRAFPSDDVLEIVFEYLIDNSLPTNIGLFRVDKEIFLNSEHRSIHIAANWDGHNESGSDSYDQEPALSGNTEDLDDRWEYIAGIYEYDSEAIEIEKNSENTLLITDIIPFTESLGSHPKSNSSFIEVKFYHGSMIKEAKPNFINSPKYRAQYTLDMLGDSGEGSNYQLPDDSYIIFNDGVDEVPTLTVKTSINDQSISFGENFTISYEIANIGRSTAYNVGFEDDFFDVLPLNFTIYQGDSDSDGDIDAFWNKIDPGVSETHEAEIFCNGSGLYLTDPELEYHASTYAENKWLRNPNDFSGGYQIEGQQAIIVCNDSAAILSLDVNIPKTSFTVGEKINLNMTIKNVGDINATNVIWQSPFIGINTTPATGFIDTIVPNQFVTVDTSFIVDHPSRFMGDFIELRVSSNYRGASVRYWYPNASSVIVLLGIETPMNIFPQTNQEYGSLVVLQKEQTTIAMNGKEYFQVIIDVKNSGDTTAYNVDINDIYPMENFTIISGSTSETWDFLPPGIEFTYSYIVEYPENISSEIQTSYLTATYDYSYSWYGGSSWEKTFDYSAKAAGSAIGDIFGVLIVLGFMSATTVAVILGVLLLRKQGFLGG